MLRKLIPAIPFIALLLSYSLYPHNTDITWMIAFFSLLCTFNANYIIFTEYPDALNVCISDPKYKESSRTANVANLAWLAAIPYQWDYGLCALVVPMLIAFIFLAPYFHAMAIVMKK